jgi:hypothetical protein
MDKDDHKMMNELSAAIRKLAAGKPIPIVALAAANVITYGLAWDHRENQHYAEKNLDLLFDYMRDSLSAYYDGRAKQAGCYPG